MVRRHHGSSGRLASGPLSMDEAVHRPPCGAGGRGVVIVTRTIGSFPGRWTTCDASGTVVVSLGFRSSTPVV